MTKAHKRPIVVSFENIFKREDYFAKTADSHQITKQCDIKREGWGLDVQRLDGTKMSIHVEYCEVSIFSTYCHVCMPMQPIELLQSTQQLIVH